MNHDDHTGRVWVEGLRPSEHEIFGSQQTNNHPDNNKHEVCGVEDIIWRVHQSTRVSGSLVRSKCVDMDIFMQRKALKVSSHRLAVTGSSAVIFRSPSASLFVKMFPHRAISPSEGFEPSPQRLPHRRRCRRTIHTNVHSSIIQLGPNHRYLAITYKISLIER